MEAILVDIWIKSKNMAKSISIEPSTYLSSNFSTKTIPCSSNTSSWRRFLRHSLLQIFRSSNSHILLPTLGYHFNFGGEGEHYLQAHGCTMDLWDLPGLHCPFPGFCFSQGKLTVSIVHPIIINYLGGLGPNLQGILQIIWESSTLIMIYQSMMVKIGGKTYADQHVGLDHLH